MGIPIRRWQLRVIGPRGRSWNVKYPNADGLTVPRGRGSHAGEDLETGELEAKCRDPDTRRNELSSALLCVPHDPCDCLPDSRRGRSTTT
jgi:hypothetical protein